MYALNLLHSQERELIKKEEETVFAYVWVWVEIPVRESLPFCLCYQSHRKVIGQTLSLAIYIFNHSIILTYYKKKKTTKLVSIYILLHELCHVEHVKEFFNYIVSNATHSHRRQNNNMLLASKGLSILYTIVVVK